MNSNKKNSLIKLPKISYVYVMRSKRYAWAAKIGKANAPKRRLADIAASIRKETGNDPDMSLFFFCPTFRPLRVETAVHNLATYPTYKRANGSGRTEWRYVLNPAAACVVIIAGYFAGLPCDWLFFTAGCAFVSPRPFDFAIYVAFLCLLEWLAIITGLYLLFKISAFF